MDPETGDKGSPMVWLDREKKELVFQGWKPDEVTEFKIDTTEWVTGHSVGIPDNEIVNRIPLRMAATIRKALDDAERDGLL
ncbi:hypothetical protein [Kitasatospora aureofaciens]|uniref:hypothetical protein n=1 Tax=Kitasatospora aureofaciens TaxID=1894 RepID=UPI0027E20F98|nr:hypothetical protein [Kitasatospora aureofaciens]